MNHTLEYNIASGLSETISIPVYVAGDNSFQRSAIFCIVGTQSATKIEANQNKHRARVEIRILSMVAEDETKEQLSEVTADVCSAVESWIGNPQTIGVDGCVFIETQYDIDNEYHVFTFALDVFFETINTTQS